MNKFGILSILALWSNILLIAQIPHEYIVKCNNLASLEFGFDISRSKQDWTIQKISSLDPIYLVRFADYFSAQQEDQILKNNKAISIYQKNFKLNERSCKPNDPEYSKQWNLVKMQIEDIWCFKNDGISPLGDTIVIGVIDEGFDYTLADLKRNIFINKFEIPDNGIDDDNNDYIDDYYGFNPLSFNPGDEHNLKNHGTNIAGLVGAIGNNKIGVSGTNQNIKMLICDAANDASLITCYSYFYKMKDEYLKSDGKKGAYVVASTISLGYDTDFVDDHPLICPLYDKLGNIGILNVCATVNRPDHDVSILGDIPSLCPSLHLIAVTNTDKNDQKVLDAGFSKEFIDIGASGENVTVMGLGGVIREESGCSLSAPQVGGTIALLNQFCPKFNALSKSNPRQASLLMRQFILECGDENASLNGITTSGRRMNALKSLKCLDAYCQDSKRDTFALTIKPNPVYDDLNLNIQLEAFGNYSIKVCNILGQWIFNQSYVNQPGQLSDLKINTNGWISGVYFVVLEFGDKKTSQAILKL